MGRTAKLIAAGLMVGTALVWWLNRQQAGQGVQYDTINDDSFWSQWSAWRDSLDSVSSAVGGAVAAVTSWGAAMTPYAIAIALPGNAEYVDYIAALERASGMPEGILTRLAWQECRFRPDIISGERVSSAGAKGMWQLIPMHWRYVDPLDWRAAGDYAADMLQRLYNRFGTWALALAAYNWGEGNLANKGIGAAPAETRNYYAQILADIGQPVLLS